MASTRYPGLTLRILAGKGPAMGPGKADLLEHIGATGSISAAARVMGMSYRRAWQLVEAMNRDFAEPLVKTAIGGTRGGGTVVTEAGKAALAAYRRMEDKASRAIARDVAAYAGLLRKPGRRGPGRDG
jgi:molybdate transport system regulatory protein